MQGQSVISGIYNILKPTGMTSSDAVVILRGTLSKRFGTKIVTGHLGTLDPGAAGVLTVAVGNSVKLFNHFLNKTKKYRAAFRFGVTTDTLDSYGRVTARDNCTFLESQLLAAVAQLVGENDQFPPAYSAKSVDGTKAYVLARKGVDVELKPKRITIFSMDYLGKTEDGQYRFDITCTSGTYIRSIVRDLASALGTVGYMSSLIRLSSGEWNIENAATIDEIKQDYLKGFTSMLDYAATFPHADFDLSEKKQLDNGKRMAFTTDSDFAYVTLGGEPYGFGEVINGEIRMIIRF